MKSLTMSSDIETSHDARLEAPRIAISGMEDLECAVEILYHRWLVGVSWCRMRMRAAYALTSC